MTEAVVGVDVGTGSARAGLFTPEGRRLGMGRHPIGLWRPDAVLAEHSSTDIWEAVGHAIRAALAEAGPVTPVSLGVCATCSLVVLDASFRPLPVSDDAERDTIVWMDHRAETETTVANATGAEALRFVGGRFSPEMQIPKLMWLKRHRPDTWARAAHFFDLPDFLTWRATGALSRSLCSLTCKWGYLTPLGRWDTTLLEATGLGDLQLDGCARIGADIKPLGALAGSLSVPAAAELGLPAGIPVGTSAIDAHAGGLGCLGMELDGEGLTQATADRRLALIGGTSSCHMAVSPAERFIPGVWGPYLSALVPGWWLTEGGQSATGALIDHVINTHPARPAAGDPFAILNARLDALASPGMPVSALTKGLHIYPDVLGNRSPHADPTLRGMVSGLGLSATEDDLARHYLATIQAIAYGTREILEALNAAGFAIDTLIVTGGGARNPRFLQEHGDATGCRVVLPEEGEAVLLGAALLGAVAAGRHGSITRAMSAMARRGETIAADPATRDLHARRFEIQRRMRAAQRDWAACEEPPP